MIRAPWKKGPARPAGLVIVSATRFHYRGWRYMPLVWWNGWRLRRRWAKREGSVGVYTGGSVSRPITYSVSAWTTKDDLQRFLRAPEHVKLVRGFRDRLAASTSVVWEMTDFAPQAAWREGMQRLEETLSRPSDAASAPDRAGSSAVRAADS